MTDDQARMLDALEAVCGDRTTPLDAIRRASVRAHREGRGAPDVPDIFFAALALRLEHTLLGLEPGYPLGEAESEVRVARFRPTGYTADDLARMAREQAERMEAPVRRWFAWREAERRHRRRTWVGVTAAALLALLGGGVAAQHGAAWAPLLFGVASLYPFWTLVAAATGFTPNRLP